MKEKQCIVLPSKPLKPPDPLGTHPSKVLYLIDMWRLLLNCFGCPLYKGPQYYIVDCLQELQAPINTGPALSLTSVIDHLLSNNKHLFLVCNQDIDLIYFLLKKITLMISCDPLQIFICKTVEVNFCN